MLEIADMRHPSFLTLLLAVFPVMAMAQTRSQAISSMPDDMGFYAGAYAPMYKGQETDVVLGLTYGHFYSNGMGYRTGFQYVSRVAEVDNAFGIPIAFAYRTRSRDTARRVERGVLSAGETFGYDVLMGYPRPLQNAIASFIANMFSQMEFFAGITPGCISGESSPVSTANQIHCS